MKSGPKFLPINLEKNWDICLNYRIDSYVASFGSALNFEKDGGASHYKEWLTKKIKNNPYSAVHIHFNEKIIGQMELGQVKSDLEIGMVNLYYLAPEYRGQNLSQYLDQYAVNFLKNLGCKKARLNVSPTNSRAIAFYHKNGWINMGPNPNHPEVHMMEKSLVGGEV